MNLLNQSVSQIEMPQSMRHLPISDRGFPIPWFVLTREDGTYDFRVMGPGKRIEAHEQKLCWVCGEKLGPIFCFVIGAVSAVSRKSAEPPSHLECGDYAVRACPWLANPRAKRNEDNIPSGARAAGGVTVKQNSGLAVLWVTRSYQFKSMLFKIGEPIEVRWYTEGRRASLAEVEYSIDHIAMPQLEREAWLYGYQGYLSLQHLVKQARESYPI